MTEQNSPTPADPKAATPPPADPEVGIEGTATKDPGEAITENPEQTAPSDTFLSNDPNSLPPELKSHYNSMLSDYKKKTTEVADKRREVESLEEKARLYDQVAGDEAFVNYYNDQIKKSPGSQSTPPQEEAGISDDEFNKAFESKEQFMNLVKRASSTMQKDLQANQNELKVQKANAFLRDFKESPGHEDFKKLDRHGFITHDILMNRPRSEKEWGTRLESAYKKAQKIYQDIHEEGRTSALTRIQEKVQSSSETPATSPTNVWPGGDPTKLSVAEAVDLARRGIKVPNTR